MPKTFKKRTNEEKELARKLYREGKNCREVGEIVGAHSVTVGRWCKDIIRKQIGENSFSYKGGSVVNGYRKIVIDGKTTYEHRYVMEKHLGRKLTKYEHIHHINHNGLDNRLENLKIVSMSEHKKEHKGYKYSNEILEDKYCKVCGKKLENKENHFPNKWKKRKFCSRACSAINANALKYKNKKEDEYEA